MNTIPKKDNGNLIMYKAHGCDVWFSHKQDAIDYDEYKKYKSNIGSRSVFKLNVSKEQKLIDNINKTENIEEAINLYMTNGMPLSKIKKFFKKTAYRAEISNI